MNRVKEGIIEKTDWIYIGDNLHNSFAFYLSKINDDTNSAVIITGKDTSDMKIFKVALSELYNNIKTKKLKRIDFENQDK